MAVSITNLVNLHDVRVLQAGDCLSLGTKAHQLRVTGMGSCQNHLERDQAVERTMPGLVDDPHRAARGLLQELIRTQRPAGLTNELRDWNHTRSRILKITVFHTDQRMKLELLLEKVAPLRKPVKVFSLGGMLPQFLARNEFGVNQFHGRFAVCSKSGILLEKFFNPAAMAGAQPPIEFGTSAAQQAFPIVVQVAVAHTRNRWGPKFRDRF